MTAFERLVAEGAAVPVEGWDFSWFKGRATEERPPWGYARLMGERMAGAEAALDIETGGGEVLATVARPPALLVATEGWRPNVTVAAGRLRPLRAHVVVAADQAQEKVLGRDGERRLVPWQAGQRARQTVAECRRPAWFAVIGCPRHLAATAF